MRGLLARHPPTHWLQEIAALSQHLLLLLFLLLSLLLS
jgi:hypothetical protein